MIPIAPLPEIVSMRDIHYKQADEGKVKENVHEGQDLIKLNHFNIKQFNHLHLLLFFF